MTVDELARARFAEEALATIEAAPPGRDESQRKLSRQMKITAIELAIAKYVSHMSAIAVEEQRAKRSV